jgi:hypothetical protein
MTDAQYIEERVRRLAKRLGYRITKSRRAPSLDNYGHFQLVDESRNFIVLGEKYDLTLDTIEEWLTQRSAAAGAR